MFLELCSMIKGDCRGGWRRLKFLVKMNVKELFTTYTTTRLLHVRSPIIVIVSWSLVVLVLVSFIVSIRLDFGRVYKSTCPIRGAVLTKVKGYASTMHLSDEDLAVGNPWAYRKFWDPTDIVYPIQVGEAETGSFLITTNLILTSNQTRGSCPDVPSESTMCATDADCRRKFWSSGTSGLLTGKCVNATGTCEVDGWCPVEVDMLPRNGKLPLLEEVENFTVLLKNAVEFPYCGNYHGTNVASTSMEYLHSCMYDADTDPLCPKFRIGDIVKWSEHDFTEAAIKGGVFRVRIKWSCDFDFGRTTNDCELKYKFSRVDKTVGISKGWNFRSSNYFANDSRTLKKQYGLKILVDLEGEGRKFDFFLFITTLGSTVGLFAVTPLVCDFLLEIFNALCKCFSCVSLFHQYSNRAQDDDLTPVGADTVNHDGKNGSVYFQGEGELNKSFASSNMTIDTIKFNSLHDS